MGLVESLLASGVFVEIGAYPGIVPELRYATANNFTGAVVRGAFERALLHKDAAAKPGLGYRMPPQTRTFRK